MTPAMPNIAARSPAPQGYGFRAIDVADLPLLRRWMAEPHVAEWWGDADDALAEIRAAIDEPSTQPMIVEMDGEPIAYLQHYDPHMEDDHPYRDQPEGTLGLDLSIGPPEYLGLGHGSAILRECAAGLLASGVASLIIDPDPDNARAIRAYEKAGFVAFDRRTTIYGPALLMARDA